VPCRRLCRCRTLVGRTTCLLTYSIYLRLFMTFWVSLRHGIMSVCKVLRQRELEKNKGTSLEKIVSQNVTYLLWQLLAILWNQNRKQSKSKPVKEYYYQYHADDRQTDRYQTASLPLFVVNAASIINVTLKLKT